MPAAAAGRSGATCWRHVCTRAPDGSAVVRQAATHALLILFCFSSVGAASATELGLIAGGEGGTYFRAVFHDGVKLGIMQAKVLDFTASLSSSPAIARIASNLRMVFPRLPHAAAPAGAGSCGTTPEAHLVVTSVERRLTLCYERREVQSFKVRLARNGWGKIEAGDARLPLGTYKVGTPRDSEKYGLFIPIGYPTATQAAAGYTGDSIGVHGPPRATRWLGSLVDRFVKTQGCVGLATDDQIRQVAAFVRARHARTISIR
jgi:hypothetical protein